MSVNETYDVKYIKVIQVGEKSCKNFAEWGLTDFVEVEGEFAGDGAVEASLEEGGPVLRQDVLAAVVLFADAGHARVHVLAAVDVLDGRLAEEKVHVVSDVVRADKVRFCGGPSRRSFVSEGTNACERVGTTKRFFFFSPNGNAEPIGFAFDRVFENGSSRRSKFLIIQRRLI